MNPGEVGQFLSEIAVALVLASNDLARTEARRATLEQALRDATARSEDLDKRLALAQAAIAAAEERFAAARDELARTQEKLTAYQDREGQIAVTLLDAQRLAEQIVESARSKANETPAAGETVGEAAGEAVGEATSETAGEAARGVEQREAGSGGSRRRGPAGTRGDQPPRRRGDPRPARSNARDAGESARGRRAAVLQALDRLRRALGDLEEVAGPPASSPDTPAAAGPPPAESEPDGPSGGIPDGPGGNGAAYRVDAEIVVGPFESFLEAAKFLTALSRTDDVQNARLRTFSRGTATIDVSLGGGGLDITRIEGYPLDIVERAGTRLVLRRPQPGGA